nr:hypothetical transcript [Hymenolepis microstoma]
MNKTSDIGSEDCRFEFRQCRGGKRGLAGFLAGATHRWPIASFGSLELLLGEWRQWRVDWLEGWRVTLTHTQSHLFKPQQASAKRQFTLRLTKCDTTSGSRILPDVTAIAIAARTCHIQAGIQTARQA